MSKKKIGLKVSQNLGINAHGAETHTVIEFMKYFSDDYEIDLIGVENYPNELENYNKFTYFKYSKFPRLLKKILHIPTSIINTIIYTYKEKPDLLFIPGGVFYNGLAIIIAGKIFGVKVLVRTAEDHFNYYKYCENFKCKLKHYFITNLVSKFVLKKADFVLTVGDKSKEYFIKNGTTKNNTFGIPGPTSQVDFLMDDSKEDLRRELNLPLNKTIILYAGAISGVKGTDELPKIIKNVLNKSDEFYFCVIGNETNGNQITNDLLYEGGNNITILSPKAHNELKKFFNACDALVFLTKVGVGYGQITIEATKAELPVVAFNPGLDVGWFLGDNAYNNIDDIVKKILSKDYNKLTFPSSFNEENIKKKHLEMINFILKGNN